MKPIVRKILESGLVSKHTAILMERWGYLENGAHGLVGKEDLKEASEDVLMKFVEDVEALIDEERDTFRETRINVQVGNPLLAVLNGLKTVVFLDSMGNFIFPPRFPVTVGDPFKVSGVKYTAEEVVSLFEQDQIYGQQVTASRAG